MALPDVAFIYLMGASLLAQASYRLHGAVVRGPLHLPMNMRLFRVLYCLAGIGLVATVLIAGYRFPLTLAVLLIVGSQFGSWLIGRIIRFREPVLCALMYLPAGGFLLYLAAAIPNAVPAAAGIAV